MARVVQSSVQITCDVCGCQCEVSGMDGARIHIMKENGHVALDLCPEHATALEAWVEQEKAAGNHNHS